MIREPVFSPAAPVPPTEESRSALLRALHHVTTRVFAGSELNDTLQLIAEGVTELARFEVAVLNIAVASGGYDVVAVVGPPDARDALLGLHETSEMWEQLIARAARWGRLCWIDHRDADGWDESMYSWVPPADDHPELAADDPDRWHPEDCLFAPLTADDGSYVGMLCVDQPVGRRKPTPAQLEVLELFADSAAQAITRAQRVESIRQQSEHSRILARRDLLTGLGNRVLLEEWMDELTAAGPTELGALVVDLDDFKSINDTYGHQAGDEVLRVIARRMQNCVRSGELLARVGGDEFVVLVHGADVRATLELLSDRLRTAVTHPIRGNACTYGVGASIGLAVATPPVTLTELLARADADMYSVKRSRTRWPDVHDRWS